MCKTLPGLSFSLIVIIKIFKKCLPHFDEQPMNSPKLTEGGYFT